MSEEAQKTPSEIPAAADAPAPVAAVKEGRTKKAPADKTPATGEAPGKTGEEAATSGDEPGKTEDKPAQPTAKDLLSDDLGQIKVRKAKGSKNVHAGICHVLATFNNTKVTFTDMNGNVISWSSSGKCNFRGSRKSTAYAAQVVTQDAGRVAMSHGMKELSVKLNGPGMGRDSAVRALQALGFLVNSIVDATPVPHNGCRAPKRRRV